MNHKDDGTTGAQHNEPRQLNEAEHPSGGHHPGHQPTGGTMRKTLHTAILILTVCLVQFFTVATLKVLNAGGTGSNPSGSGTDCVSGDVNSDDALNIADAIYVLTYLFNGGPEPVACAGNPTEVVVTNTPDVNVTNIPEVVVTNTADINVVSIPPVVISSMPLVSDDFVSALGQFFPKAGSYNRTFSDYSINQTVTEIIMLSSDFVPEGKLFRITKFVDYRIGGSGSNYGSSNQFTRGYINGTLVGQTFESADFPWVLRPGDVLEVKRDSSYNANQDRRIELVGYFLDYTPQP
jgi:hypothetical protein